IYRSMERLLRCVADKGPTPAWLKTHDGCTAAPSHTSACSMDDLLLVNHNLLIFTSLVSFFSLLRLLNISHPSGKESLDLEEKIL
ncbi:hypothetical protein ACQP3C_28840, partial [Escherichia coli]